MDKKSIDKELSEIFLNKVKINFIDNEQLRALNLFGKEINLTPYEMIYIFFDLENHFKIRFKEENIINEDFTTYNRILNILENTLV